MTQKARMVVYFDPRFGFPLKRVTFVSRYCQHSSKGLVVREALSMFVYCVEIYIIKISAQNSGFIFFYGEFNGNCRTIQTNEDLFSIHRISHKWMIFAGFLRYLMDWVEIIFSISKIFLLQTYCSLWKL